MATEKPTPTTLTYRVDRNNRLTFVDEGWEASAATPETRELTAENLIGQPLETFLCDYESYEIYRALIEKVRASGRAVEFPLRCDSPEVRRYMRMRISAYGKDEVQFESRVIKAESREPQPLLSIGALRSNAYLVMCGWCKRIRHANDRWEEVEIVVRDLNLMEAPKLPNLTHGVCPSCYDDMMRLLAESSAS